MNPNHRPPRGEGKPSKVAYILHPGNISSNVFSGVVRQALTWADRLRDLGIDVDFPVAHEAQNWAGYELVHLFQYGNWADGLIRNFAAAGLPAVLSPIVDRSEPFGWRGNLVARIPFERLGLSQNQRVLYRHSLGCHTVLARSALEARSLASLGISQDRIRIVRLGVDVAAGQLRGMSDKQRHVFHMSHLSQRRKNVRALIEACRRICAPLRLAGKISDATFRGWLERECSNDPNLTYLGTISEDQKWQEMQEAQVFCLPSLNEGIGLVALEAHLAGAHVVITKRSGGVDYFDGEVEVCDPTSTTDITRCLKAALTKPALSGPRLDLMSKLSSEATVGDLVQVYSMAVLSNGESP